jgi:hypothetical protein
MKRERKSKGARRRKMKKKVSGRQKTYNLVWLLKSHLVNIDIHPHIVVHIHATAHSHFHASIPVPTRRDHRGIGKFGCGEENKEKKWKNGKMERRINK